MERLFLAVVRHSYGNSLCCFTVVYHAVNITLFCDFVFKCPRPIALFIRCNALKIRSLQRDMAEVDFPCLIILCRSHRLSIQSRHRSSSIRTGCRFLTGQREVILPFDILDGHRRFAFQFQGFDSLDRHGNRLRVVIVDKVQLILIVRVGHRCGQCSVSVIGYGHRYCKASLLRRYSCQKVFRHFGHLILIGILIAFLHRQTVLYVLLQLGGRVFDFCKVHRTRLSVFCRSVLSGRKHSFLLFRILCISYLEGEFILLHVTTVQRLGRLDLCRSLAAQIAGGTVAVGERNDCDLLAIRIITADFRCADHIIRIMGHICHRGRRFHSTCSRIFQCDLDTIFRRIVGISSGIVFSLRHLIAEGLACIILCKPDLFSVKDIDDAFLSIRSGLRLIRLLRLILTESDPCSGFFFRHLRIVGSAFESFYCELKLIVCHIVPVQSLFDHDTRFITVLDGRAVDIVEIQVGNGVFRHFCSQMSLSVICNVDRDAVIAAVILDASDLIATRNGFRDIKFIWLAVGVLYEVQLSEIQRYSPVISSVFFVDGHGLEDRPVVFYCV